MLSLGSDLGGVTQLYTCIYPVLWILNVFPMTNQQSHSFSQSQSVLITSKGKSALSIKRIKVGIFPPKQVENYLNPSLLT